MVDPTFCIGDIWCGLGLPHILLWVLTFAVVFGVLQVIKVFGKDGKRINALVALVSAFFVLMAVPATLITVVANMSTSLIAVAIGLITLMAFLTISKIDENGKFWGTHSTLATLILAAIALLVFAGAGGLSLIGLGSLPSIGLIFSTGTWVLILMGIAVLWLVFSKDEPSKGPGQ